MENTKKGPGRPPHNAHPTTCSGEPIPIEEIERKRVEAEDRKRKKQTQRTKTIGEDGQISYGSIKYGDNDEDDDDDEDDDGCDNYLEGGANSGDSCCDESLNNANSHTNNFDIRNLISTNTTKHSSTLPFLTQNQNESHLPNADNELYKKSDFIKATNGSNKRCLNQYDDSDDELENENDDEYEKSQKRLKVNNNNENEIKQKPNDKENDNEYNNNNNNNTSLNEDYLENLDASNHENNTNNKHVTLNQLNLIKTNLFSPNLASVLQLKPESSSNVTVKHSLPATKSNKCSYSIDSILSSSASSSSAEIHNKSGSSKVVSPNESLKRSIESLNDAVDDYNSNDSQANESTTKFPKNTNDDMRKRTHSSSSSRSNSSSSSLKLSNNSNKNKHENSYDDDEVEEERTKTKSSNESGEIPISSQYP